MKLSRKEKEACKRFAILQGFTSFRGVKNADYVRFRRDGSQYAEKELHIDEIIERTR